LDDDKSVFRIRKIAVVLGLRSGYVGFVWRKGCHESWTDTRSGRRATFWT